MKRILKQFLLGVGFVASGYSAFAQVDVTATAGTLTATYPTLNGAFAAINGGTHQGVITINITANTTEPAAAVPLVSSGTGSASYSSILIRPTGNVTVNSAAAPTASRGVIEFLGADNVTIDGDDPGTAGTRNLTFQAAQVATTGVVVIRYASASAADGATNNTIKNCIVIGSRTAGTSTVTNYGIYSGTSGTSTVSTSGQSDNNDNLTIENNEVYRCYWGIYCAGTTTNYMDGLIIRNNIIGQPAPANAVANRGIYVQNTQALSSPGATVAIIEGNDIRITASTNSTAAAAGIEIANGNAGLIFRKNKLHDMYHANTGGYGMYAISVTGATNNSQVEISNNFIWDITNDNWSAAISATSTDLPVGLRVSAGATQMKIYNNTFSLNAANTDPATAGYSACMQLTTTGITGSDIRNNIFANTQTGNAASKYVCVVVPSGFPFGTINNNNYYGANAYNIIGWNGADRTTLAAWQAQTTQDANSYNVVPPFVSTTDLHLIAATTTFLESNGATIAAITTDIDGDVRPGPTGSVNGGATGYDIGADEFDGTPIPVCTGTPAAANALSSNATVCSGVSFNLSLSVTYLELGYTYQWQSSPDGITYTDISGATNATLTTSQTADTYYQCVITCSNSTLSVTSTPVQVTMSPFISCYCTPTYSSGCGTGADAITNVVLSPLSNASGCAGTPYYTFYNAVTVPDLYRGTGFATVSVTMGSDGSQFAAVWIDWNQNGSFADPGEFIGNNTVNAGANGTVSFTINVPAGATLGQTMMRIRGGNDSQLANTPCGASSSSFGETEDYLVNVMDGTVCSGTPAAANTVASSAIVCPTVNFGLSLDQVYTDLTIGFQWQSSTDGVTYTNISGATNFTLTTSQTVPTYYQCVITCGASSLSTTSTPVLVNNYANCVSMPATGSLSTCDAKFYDSGGASSSYAASENRTFTFFPGSPGAKVIVTFSSFDTEGGFDFLKIFDGNSIAAPALHTGNGFSGLGITPTTFTSTAADGSLTFVFTSDVSVQNAGWDANITCLLPPADPATPVQDPAAPTCAAGTDLTVPGSPASGDEWYWQTSATGTSTANPVSGPYTVFINGTYYVRTFNPTTGLWSNNATSVVVSNIPVATAPPAPIAGANPACISTSLTMTPSGDPNITYYWQGTNSMGNDNTNDAVNPYAVTTSGTYYVAAFDASIGCWSIPVGTAVTIDTYIPGAPVASNVNVCIGSSSAMISAATPTNTSSSMSSGTINLAIPDNNVAGNSSTLALSGIPAGAVPTAIDVNFSIQHTWDSDLSISLTGPNGNTVDLSSGNGGSGDNYQNTTITNSVSNPVTGGTAPFSGIYSPEGDLTTLYSILNGNWTLKVVDGAGGDVGTLFNWTVTVHYNLPPSTITWWDASSGPAQVGAGSPFEAIGTSVMPDANSLSTYTFFAQAEVGACVSPARTQVDVTVDPFTATINPIDISCTGANDGSFAVVNDLCGTAPYQFSTDGGATYSASIPANLTAGSYDVVVMDDNGYTTSISTITIAEPTALTSSATASDALCNAGNSGSVDLTVSGGTSPYTFAWDNTATTEDLTGVTAGTYAVVVTDARGCTSSSTATVAEPSAIVLTETHLDVDCNNASTGSIDLTATGGTPAYAYAWDNGATTEDISGLAAATYTVTLTDANGCTATLGVTVTEPSAISIVVTSTTSPSACGTPDGAADITVSGGTPAYNFVWSTGATTEDLSGVVSGSYDVMVTDNNGCTSSATVAISDINPPVITVDNVTDLLCNGASTGAIDVTLSAGTSPYGTSWDNGSTTEDLASITAGTYVLTVTDAAGCVAIETVTVAEPSAITINAISTNISCNGLTDGSVDITLGGGIVAGAYTIAWTDGASFADSNEDISALPAATYTVTVTDDNACTATASYTIIDPAPVAVTGVASDVNCNGGADGSIDVTATGGTVSSVYTYAWTDGGTFTSSTEDLSAIPVGTYDVVVTDDNGCSATASFTLSEPTAIALSASSSDEINGNDGSVNLTVSGGVSPYTFAWDNGATTEDLTGVAGGTYTVTVTDANGCTDQVTVVVSSQVGLLEVNDVKVSVYPNPGNGIFFVQLSSIKSSSDMIIVRDAIGREVVSMNVTKTISTIDLSTQESGVYFVEITSGSAKVTQKVVLQR